MFFFSYYASYGSYFPRQKDKTLTVIRKENVNTLLFYGRIANIFILDENKFSSEVLSLGYYPNLLNIGRFR